MQLSFVCASVSYFPFYHTLAPQSLMWHNHQKIILYLYSKNWLRHTVGCWPLAVLVHRCDKATSPRQLIKKGLIQGWQFQRVRIHDHRGREHGSRQAVLAQERHQEHTSCSVSRSWGGGKGVRIRSGASLLGPQRWHISSNNASWSCNKEFHQTGAMCSNIWPHGNHSHSNHHLALYRLYNTICDVIVQVPECLHLRIYYFLTEVFVALFSVTYTRSLCCWFFRF